MDDDKQYVIEQQMKRFAALKFIWKETRDSETLFSPINEICDAIQVNQDELLQILGYLEAEGLIKRMIYLGQPTLSQVTYLGKVEIENAITRPSEDTEHFSSKAITFIMNQTNITAGRDAIGNVTSSTNPNISTTVTYSTNETLEAIAELRQQINTLAEENQDVATDALDTLESEVKSPTKPTKVKTALFSLWGIAQGIASFANAVTAIADRFGVKFHQ